MSSMTPQEIVSELDNHIVGQGAAKRAVEQLSSHAVTLLGAAR